MERQISAAVYLSRSKHRPGLHFMLSSEQARAGEEFKIVFFLVTNALFVCSCNS